jgi:hypothetical protein
MQTACLRSVSGPGDGSTCVYYFVRSIGIPSFRQSWGVMDSWVAIVCLVRFDQLIVRRPDGAVRFGPLVTDVELDKPFGPVDAAVCELTQDCTLRACWSDVRVCVGAVCRCVGDVVVVSDVVSLSRVCVCVCARECVCVCVCMHSWVFVCLSVLGCPCLLCMFIATFARFMR